MNVLEFSREFNILYDNITSNSAPGLNEYDKSVMLTKAQEEIVKNYYSGYNQIKNGFESTEKRRGELEQLVIPYKTTTQITSTNGISSASKFFKIPEEVFYITFEQVKLISVDPCLNGKYINVKPVTHDEFNVSIKSPFRKPNKNRAWRLNVTKQSDERVVEIVSAYPIEEYTCRYIKQPKPIILTDFESDPDLTGMNLSIEGENTVTECELNAEVHRDILNRAVELAVRSYRENTLQNNVQLNTRNV